MSIEAAAAALLPRVVESALGGAVLSLLVVLVAVVVLRVSGTVSAATRFAVWLTALLMAAALPCILFLRPATLGTVGHTEPAVSVRVAAAAAPDVVPEDDPSGHMAAEVAHIPVAAVAIGAPVASMPAAPALPAPQGDSPSWKPVLHLDDVAVFVSLYCAIAGVLLLRLTAGYLRLRRIRRTSVLPDEEVSRRLRLWLARIRTSRSVELRLADAARSPMAIGFARPMILLPPSLLLELTESEFDAIGLHELAHIRRYDDWTTLLQRIICALFFFVPAVQIASRRMSFEREVACDDAVITALGQTRQYAECLARVAELAHWRWSPVLASGVGFRKRQIFRRVEMVLDRARNTAPRVSALSVIAALVLLLGIAFEAAKLDSVVAFDESSNGTRIHSSSTIDGRRFIVDISGELVLSEDEKSVGALPYGSSLRIEERSGWSRRAFEARGVEGGRTETRLLIDGRERPLDEAGRQWLSAVLPKIVRDFGIDIPGRARRILERRGAIGLLEEVDLITNDGSRLRYLTELINWENVETEHLRRALRKAGKTSSDGDRAQFLLAMLERVDILPLRAEYFDVLNSIGSDGDRRRVLTEVIQRHTDDKDILAMASRAAERMGSDGDKAHILALAAEQTGSKDVAVRSALLRAISSVGSDGERARVLREAVKTYTDNPQLRVDFFAALNKIGSDGERAGILRELAVLPGLDPETLREIAASAQRLGSDHDKVSVLEVLATRYTHEPLFAAALTVGSDSERKRLLLAITNGPVSDEALLRVVDAGITIGSDNEKADVLLAVAKKASAGPVREAVLRAASKIGSDTEYRRVVTALLEEHLSAKS